MKSYILVLLLTPVLVFAQMQVKNSSGTELMVVDQTGTVTIGAASMASLKLDVQGKTRTASLQIGTSATTGYVLTTDTQGNASWQEDAVVKSISVTGTGTKTLTLTRGKGLANLTETFTDLVDDADASPTNEIQTLSLSNRTLSLSRDGGAVTLGGYAYYPAFKTILFKQPPVNSDFRWYSYTELGVPQDAKAVVIEAAVANNTNKWAAIVIATHSFTNDNMSSLETAIAAGSHLTAWTDARIEQEVATLTLDPNNGNPRIYIGHMGIPDVGRVHVFGYYR